MLETLNIRGTVDVAPVSGERERRERAVSPGAASAAGTDEAVFSPAAARASEAARLRELAEEPASELRAAELELVRSRIRDGAHRVQEAVLQVAVRIAPIVDRRI